MSESLQLTGLLIGADAPYELGKGALEWQSRTSDGNPAAV
jgi:hypothetical protein